MFAQPGVGMKGTDIHKSTITVCKMTGNGSLFKNGRTIMNDKKCCPLFDPAPWDEETHTRTDKVFLKGSVPQIFHIPLPFMYGRTIAKMR